MRGRGRRLVTVLALALALAPAPRAAAADGIDFAELLRLSEVYRSVRHDSVDETRAAWNGTYRDLTIVDLPATRNRYLVGTLDGHREVVVRGTANVVNAIYDAEVLMRWSPQLGMWVHRGFDAMARVLHDDLRPRLERGSEVVLFGHSLGAAEALLLGLLLARDGYVVRQVYASGQPRVTDHRGGETHAAFPVLRVSCELDPVPFLPPRLASPERPYAHFGREIILLDGPWYTEAAVRAESDERSGAAWELAKRTGARMSWREHMIDAYLRRLRGKDRKAIEVPYEQRMEYLEQGPEP